MNNTTFGYVIPVGNKCTRSRPSPRRWAARRNQIVLGSVAETDPALLVGTEFDIGDLVRGDQDLAALGHRQREDGMAPVGQRAGQLALDLLGRSIGLHDQLARYGMNADLDFHGAPL